MRFQNLKIIKIYFFILFLLACNSLNRKDSQNLTGFQNSEIEKNLDNIAIITCTDKLKIIKIGSMHVDQNKKYFFVKPDRYQLEFQLKSVYPIIGNTSKNINRKNYTFTTMPYMVNGNKTYEFDRWGDNRDNYVINIWNKQGEFEHRKVINKIEIESFLNNFYSQKQDPINIYKSKMLLGNPNAKLRIIAITDFLCAPCHDFLKYLMKQPLDKIYIEFYNYPLDINCNKSINRSIHENSCYVSKTFITIAEIGLLEDYLKFFLDDNKIRNNSTTNDFNSLIKDFFNLKKLSEKDLDEYNKIFNSIKVKDRLNKDIIWCKEYGIEGVPTIYINNKKIIGLPPSEFLDIIFEKELKE